MKGIFFKVVLIVFILATLTYAEDDAKKQLEEYKKSVEFMTELLKGDRDEVKKTMSNARATLDGRAKKIEKDAKDLEKRADHLESQAAELDKKEKDLIKKKEECDKKHAELIKKQDEFKKNMKENGDLREKSRKWNHMYLPEDAVIHHNIRAAYDKKIIRREGNPRHFNVNSYRNGWHRRPILRVGHGYNSYRNGISVNIPSGYNVLWLRCSNHVWGNFYITYEDRGIKHLGQFVCGHRNLNEISPDGAAPDSYHRIHMWMPIPIKKAGKHIIHAGHHCDGWISGIAWSKNLWNHARNSAVAYHWRLNGGSALQYHNPWNNDVLCMINKGNIWELVVPVAPSGKDKLLYLVEHNNNWIGTMHTSVSVNGRRVARLSTAYRNPFATHFNSKYYDRYIATKIPKELIPAYATHVRVVIDMRMQDHNIYIREAGTHDYN